MTTAVRCPGSGAEINFPYFEYPCTECRQLVRVNKTGLLRVHYVAPEIDANAILADLWSLFGKRSK